MIFRIFLPLKKDLAVHTRLSPSQRFDQLQILIENIRKTPEAVKQITNWGLELDDDLNIVRIFCIRYYFKFFK